MARPKVLAIIGSPRRGGNTEILVERILEGAQSAGAETRKFTLTDLAVSPCAGCDGCVGTRSCVIQDDLGILIEAMTQSDVWVFGTPVYYAGPTAQFKAFMDRWYCMDQGIFKGKKAIIAIPLGDKPEIARHTEGMFREALEFQGSEIVEMLLAPHSFELGSVNQQSELLERAYRVGALVTNETKAQSL